MANEVKKSDLVPRLLVAAVGIPILLAAAIRGPNWILWAIVAGAGMIGAHEILSMTLKSDLRTGGWWGFAGIGGIFVSIYWFDERLLTVTIILLTLLGVLFTETFSKRPMDEALKRVQAIMMSFVYTTILFGGYILLFRHVPQTQNWESQAGWFLFPMFVIWAGDTGAYFAGKFWGKNKLAPSVSPAKSWEGAAGGVVWSLGFGYVAWALFLQGEMTALQVPIYAIPAAILGQMGDLAESMIKRGTGYKDSGSLLPGHGGMLDRVDALIVASPYMLLVRELLQLIG